jgi:hypothetical protein
MSYVDIQAATRKREETDAAKGGRRGRKMKEAETVPASTRSKKSRKVEIEEATREINASEWKEFCSQEVGTF